MLGRDGENVTCPTCHMIMKVIVCASRKDLYAFPVVTLQTHGVVETVRQILAGVEVLLRVWCSRPDRSC